MLLHDGQDDAPALAPATGSFLPGEFQFKPLVGCSMRCTWILL